MVKHLQNVIHDFCRSRRDVASHFVVGPPTGEDEMGMVRVTRLRVNILTNPKTRERRPRDEFLSYADFTTFDTTIMGES